MGNLPSLCTFKLISFGAELIVAHGNWSIRAQHTVALQMSTNMPGLRPTDKKLAIWQVFHYFRTFIFRTEVSLARRDKFIRARHTVALQMSTNMAGLGPIDKKLAICQVFHYFRTFCFGDRVEFSPSELVYLCPAFRGASFEYQQAVATTNRSEVDKLFETLLVLDK